MRTWVVALMLAMLALSGCAEETGSEAAETEDSHAADAGGNATADADVPDAMDTEDTAGNATGNATQSVPLSLDASIESESVNAGESLNFTIDGDGEATMWNITIDDVEVANGSELPATYSHLFETAGTFTANVTLTDGSDTEVATFTIEVIDLGPCGGEAEPCIVAEHDWVTVWSDGRCDAKGRVYGHEAGGWVHDRPGGPSGVVPFLGGGTWWFEEGNGIDGLQLTMEPSVAEDAKDPLAVEFNCQGGDILLL